MDNKSLFRIILILFAPILILLIPLLAMLIIVEVNWSLMDFVVVYVILAGGGVVYELITRKPILENIISWLFGVALFAIGVINTFWGNDSGFGFFIVLLSLVYFPSTNAIFKKWSSFSIHRVVKILLVVFILWAALGVGELFHKINLMMKDLIS